MQANIQTGSHPLGLDLSSHNANINWSLLQQQNFKFAYVKLSQGDYYINPLYRLQIESARKIGLITGTYHYYDPNIPIQRQIDFFLKNLHDGPNNIPNGELPPCLDFEEPGTWTTYNPGTQQLISDCSQFVTYVKRATNRDVLIYTFKWWWIHNTNQCTLFAATNPLWYAQYAPAPSIPLIGGWQYYTFWQYTSQGNVSGIPGNADISVFNGNIDRLRALAHFQ